MKLEDHFDAEMELAGCEIQLEDLARSEKFGRWALVLAFCVLAALEWLNVSLRVSTELVGVALLVFAVVVEVIREIRRHAVYNRVLIIRIFNSLLAQSRREAKAIFENLNP